MTSPIRTGIWRTDGGSELNIKVQDGRIEGHYRSIHGQPQPDESFPVIGFVNGELAGFVCSWGKYQSITSWCGRYSIDNGRECIRTAWHLGRVYADRAHTQENEYWESFVSYTGTYYFVE